jgi:hypothetical protein
MEMELTYDSARRSQRFDTGPAGHGAPGVGVAADRSSHTRHGTRSAALYLDLYLVSSYLCELCIAARARRGRGLGAVGGGALTLTPGLFSVLSLAVKLVYIWMVLAKYESHGS